VVGEAGEATRPELPADAVSMGPLSVYGVRIPEPLSGDQVSVYAEIVTSGAADTLVSVTSERARSGSLHVMTHEGGMMSMGAVSGLVIPEGGRLSLTSGERHGMLEGLDGDWSVGDRVPVLFRFSSGAEIRVVAPVLSVIDAAEVPSAPAP